MSDQNEKREKHEKNDIRVEWKPWYTLRTNKNSWKTYNKFTAVHIE